MQQPAFKISRLRAMRKRLKLKLRNVAELIHSSPQMVWKQEQYGIKTIRIAKRYATALNCDWKDLLD